MNRELKGKDRTCHNGAYRQIYRRLLRMDANDGRLSLERMAACRRLAASILAHTRLLVDGLCRPENYEIVSVPQLNKFSSAHLETFFETKKRN